MVSDQLYPNPDLNAEDDTRTHVASDQDTSLSSPREHFVSIPSPTAERIPSADNNQFNDEEARNENNDYLQLIGQIANKAPHLKPLLDLPMRRGTRICVLEPSERNPDPVVAEWPKGKNKDQILELIRAANKSSTLHLILMENLSPYSISFIEKCSDGHIPNPQFLASHVLRTVGSPEAITSTSHVETLFSTQKLQTLDGQHASLRWWRPFERATFPPSLTEDCWRTVLESGKCSWRTSINAKTPDGASAFEEHSFVLNMNIQRDEWHPITSRNRQGDLAAWEERISICAVGPRGKSDKYIVLMDWLPKLSYTDSATDVSEKWWPILGTVQRGRPPRTFDDKDTIRHGEELESYLETVCSTRQDLISWLTPNAAEDTGNSLSDIDFFDAILRIIESDTRVLVEIIVSELNAIAQDTLNEAILQENLSKWRQQLSKYTLELRSMRQSLDNFHTFMLNCHSNDRDKPQKAKARLENIQKLITTTIEQTEQSYTTMRTEISMLDSRRGIAEAESVGKLTELAFIFIPVTSAASIFSMQITALADPVPTKYFVAACFVILALSYGLRLLVRTQLLRDVVHGFVEDVRIYAKVQPNRPIPTRKFLSFLLIEQRVLYLMLISSSIIMPIVVPLWIRTTLDVGFKTGLTVLMLLVVFLAAGYAIRKDEGGVVRRGLMRFAKRSFGPRRVRRGAAMEA